jgi:hypothetical protein
VNPSDTLFLLRIAAFFATRAWGSVSLIARKRTPGK